MRDNIIFLGFADNKIPEFKEVKSKDYILFGNDNKFPDQLLYLYNKSSNHGAIINGKVKYIFGKGLPIEGTKLVNVNRHNESLNKVVRKTCTDIELFGGFYWQIIWKLNKTLEVYHMPFQQLRRGKDDKGWFHKKDWSKTGGEVFIPDFDPENPTGSQIFAYKEYRAGADTYALPGYFASLNDIETDVEISKYNLSTIKNGLFGGKMVTFFNGDPGEEAKKKLEKAWTSKFNGSENSGKTMMVFLNNGQQGPQVEDLSSTDLDKLFDQLNKTTQAEIFTGHEITSPMLFGIKTEGQLGGREEIATAYEIFKNTYVNHKQESLEEAIAFIYPYFGVTTPLKLESVSPVGFHLPDDKMAEIMPKQWVYDQLGVDIAKYPELAAPAAGTTEQPMATNENVKNMTGRQFQNLNRVITKYKNGKLDKAAAVLLLKNSFGLSDDDIETLLSTDAGFDKEYTEEEVCKMFESIGQSAQNFSIVKSRPYRFEEHYDEFADIKQTDSDILNLIGKDKRITPQVIGETLKLDPYYVAERIKNLERIGVLVPTTQTIGIDTIIERAINPEQIDTRAKPETIDVYIKYSYEPKPGLKPIIETTRPFCKKLIELNRLYTRAEIESISQRVGFSVWDRRGGFWGSSPSCRHEWKRNIVIKKK